jgi:uncharacterized protein YqhQ
MGISNIGGEDMGKKTSIGGQAVIEGVMMRGPQKVATAVRKPDGEIDIRIENNVPLTKRNKLFGLPIIRGAVALFDSLSIGIKTLSYSASFFEEEEESKFDKYIKKKFGDKAESFYMWFSLALSIAIAVGLFFILPTYAANFIKKLTLNSIVINLIEGLIRLIIFLVYIYLISKLEDIQRVFQYHGAEHKSIFCYEQGLPLTPENAAKFKTLHPRCGTNFLLIVMIVSIFVFAFLGWPNFVWRIISRVILLPVIAGISYEFIKWLGKSESTLAKVLSYPGLMLQKLTTREPDEKQLEVAIAALLAVIPEGEDDIW